MPYRIRRKPIKSNKNYAIEKKDGGSWKIVGRSKTKEDAKRSIHARYANE